MINQEHMPYKKRMVYWETELQCEMPLYNCLL
jgi:hypothetical protein